MDNFGPDNAKKCTLKFVKLQSSVAKYCNVKYSPTNFSNFVYILLPIVSNMKKMGFKAGFLSEKSDWIGTKFNLHMRLWCQFFAHSEAILHV